MSVTPGSETSWSVHSSRARHGGLHVVGVERPGDLERDDPGPSRWVGGERGERVERAGGDDLAGAVDVGGVSPWRSIVASTSSGSPPSTALIPVGVAALASAIARPRSATKRIASVSESTPAPAAAVISPTECPASAPVPVDATASVLVVAGQRAQGEQAGADEQRLGDGGVLDGVLVGRRAVRDEVDLGGVGEGGQPVTQAGQLEPRAEEAPGSGSPGRGRR